ncbi:hypothetical protein KC946_00130 [Candidatus Saccharibacteria bacterium]|nr:hypothetical protein [Candidatus Saccharibacteria bacterium]
MILKRLRVAFQKYKDYWIAIPITMLIVITGMFFVARSKQINIDKNVNSVTIDSDIAVSDGVDSTKALQRSEIEWKKKLKPTSPSEAVDGTIIEKIDVNQNYNIGSLKLPDGWKAQWSLSPLNTAKASIVWLDEEPTSGRVNFIRISMGSRDSLRPNVQTSIEKPLSSVKLDNSGYTPSAPILHDKKIYQVMMGVNVVTNPTKYNLDCYDLTTYDRCTGYPKYVSSANDKTLTGNDKVSVGIPKDISTPMNMQIIEGSNIVDQSVNNEGKIYFPGQKKLISGESQYGVVCVNLDTQKNCGYTVLGSQATTPNGTLNPAIINGFIESDNKLYGHANDNDETRQTVVCYDMVTSSPCSGFSSTTFAKTPVYKVQYHQNSYDTPGTHAMSGTKLFWQVNYRHGNSDLIFNESQHGLGSILACFDVATKLPCPGTGQVEGWSHPLGGAVSFSGGFGTPRGYSTFISKLPLEGGGYEDKAVCTIYGTSAGALDLDPSVRCFTIEEGIFIQGGSGSGTPPFLLPNQWLIPPWTASPNITTITDENGHLKSYFPMYTTVETVIHSGKKKGATLCYDWETQSSCANFGNKLRYWHDINNGDSADVGYVYDGQCMWAAGSFGNIWSFNAQTGEYPCRSSQLDLKVDTTAKNFYCDSNQKPFAWDRIRLSKSSLYNFDSLQVVVKDEQGNVLKQGDIRQTGYLDISDIDFNSNQSLDLEVVPTVLNTSPWANGSAPYVSALMQGADLDYCYKTTVIDHCNISGVTTSTDAIVEGETDILNPVANKIVPVNQPNDVQCFRDLKSTPKLSKTSVSNSENITFEVAVKNKANRDQYNLGDVPSSEDPTTAKVEVQLPSGVNFVSSSPAGGVKTGNKVVWSNQSVAATNTKNYSVTVQTPEIGTTSFNNTKNNQVVLAAITQQTLTFKSNVIYSSDTNQSDNSSTSTVTFANETIDPPIEDTNPPVDDTPIDAPSDEDQNVGSGQTNDNSGGPTSPELLVRPDTFSTPSVTPKVLQRFIPSSLQGVAEGFFVRVGSIARPIPNSVAKAIPYGTIAILLLVSSYYLLLAYRARKSQKQMVEIRERFKRTEDLRRNFIDLTSHYINTPIATMNSTVELLVMMKQLPTKTTNALKRRVSSLTEHTRMLLRGPESLTEQAQQTSSKLNPLPKRASWLGLGVILPVTAVIIITVLVNLTLIWVGKYDASQNVVIVQTSYFLMAALALVATYIALKKQKLATAITENEFKLERQLVASQNSFISDISTSLDEDIAELDQVVPAVKKASNGKTFIHGLDSLKVAVGKMAYLNQLSTKDITKTKLSSNLKGIVSEVIEEQSSFAKREKIKINQQVENDIRVLADDDTLRRILQSTINNAIKFNNTEGMVDVKIASQGRNKVKILVKDNGVGIAKDKLDEIFEPFGRATDSKEFNFEGLGLDLYIDRLLVEQLGGTIEVNSVEGTGTEVSIILPSK